MCRKPIHFQKKRFLAKYFASIFSGLTRLTLVKQLMIWKVHTRHIREVSTLLCTSNINQNMIITASSSDIFVSGNMFLAT